MRNLIPFACLCSAVALFSGCASDVDSPFAMSKKEIKETVVVEVSADNKVKLNGSSVAVSDLAESLQAQGRETPGKKVTLIVEDGFDPAAVPQIERWSARAGLGTVTVLTSEKPKTVDVATPAPEPTPSPAPVAAPEPVYVAAAPAAPAPVAAPAPAPVTITPARPSTANAPAPVFVFSDWETATPQTTSATTSAPVTTYTPEPEPTPAPAPVVAPAPSPAPVTASPWTPVVQSNVVRIDISSSTEFKVNNAPVEFGDLPAALAKLGAESPGKKVEIYTEPGYESRAILYIRDAVRKAGLGAIEGKK